MKKNKLIPLLIIGFFLTSIISGFVGSTIHEAINNNSKVILPSSDGWSEGETVKTDIEFNPHIPQAHELTYMIWEQDEVETVIIEDVAELISDDNDYFMFQVTFNPRDNWNSFEFYFRIYCGGAGTLTYRDMIGYTEDVGYNGIGTSQDDGTLTVTSSMLDGEGYMYFKVTLIATTVSVTYYTQYSNSGGYSTLHNDVGTGSAIADCGIIQWRADAFYFTRDTIENYIRSEHKYVSDTELIHRLIIPSIPHAKEINVYAPTTWDYSSINPTATVTESGNDYVIGSPTELSYEMFFTSHHSYLMPLKDVTENYLSDVGFETGEWVNDWQDYSSGFSTHDIDTSISFDGYHSLKLTDSDGSTDYFRSIDGLVDAGFYYISFCYFVESFSGTNFYFISRQDSDAEYELLDTTITDRWVQVFCAYYIEGQSSGSGVCWDFQFSSAQGTVYIDNFRIFQPSTEIETIDLDSYKISSTYISWDSYQNPIVTNINCTTELYDRTSQTKIAYAENITDSNGQITWTYSSSLLQKEYLIRSYSYENRFSDFWDEHFGYSHDFDDGLSRFSFYKQSQVDSYSMDVENGYLNFQMSKDESLSSTYCYVMYYFDDFTTISSIEDYSFIMRSREIIKDTNHTHIFYQNSTSDNIFPLTLLKPIDETWTIDFIDKNNFSLSGETDISVIGFRDNNEIAFTNYDFEFQIDFILLVQPEWFVNWTFTPSYCYEQDFGELIELDSYDFSEGDDEDVYAYIYGNLNKTENGFIQIEKTSIAQDYFATRWQFDNSFSTTTYSKLVFRARLTEIDIGSNWQILFAIYDNGVYDQQGFKTDINSTWTIFELTLEDSKTATDFRFTIYENSDNVTAKSHIQIDYIRLVHVEDYSISVTDAHIRLDSENSAWTNKVYSDDCVIGEYSEPNIYSLNGTIGSHNFSWIPFSRTGEQKAFLYSEQFSYTYTHSIENNYYLILNSPSFDVDGGYLYVDIVTYWGNQTVRIADNGTWLGSAVPEGNSVWEWDSSVYGTHNFTVYIYNGAQTWDVLTAYITIVEPSTSQEDCTFHFYSTVDGFGLDKDVARIYIKDTIHTNWSRVNSDCVITGNNFSVQVEDYFGNVIHTELDINYSRHYDIGLPLMKVFLWYNNTEYNSESIPITVYLSKDNYTMTFSMAQQFSMYELRLISGDYNVTCVPEDRYSSDSSFEFFTSKEEITIDTSTGETVQSFSVGVQGREVYSEDEGEVNWWGIIGTFATICTILGFGINWYFKKRQTKEAEKQTQILEKTKIDKPQQDYSYRYTEDNANYSEVSEEKRNNRY